MVKELKIFENKICEGVEKIIFSKNLKICYLKQKMREER